MTGVGIDPLKEFGEVAREELPGSSVGVSF
jgi:hypothetical protein